MLTERKFNIVKVVPGKGIGMDEVKKFDKVIIYQGSKVEIKL
jgi:hypothetical protein